MEWYEIIVSILSGLAVAIPLVVELVQWVKKAIEEKNWNQLVSLLMNLMAEAEGKFDNGADRKSWVLGAVESAAKTINYPVDIEQVSELIDALCAMSKKVNYKAEEVSE